MSKPVFIKPREGLLVRHPRTFVHLPAQGKSVSWNGYWKRLLSQGDIEIISKPPTSIED